ncbi:unnamed protein product, partial [Closterium sp. NIES-54]
MYLFHRQQQLMRVQQQKQQQQQEDKQQREKQHEGPKAEWQEQPLDLHRTSGTEAQPAVRVKEEACGDDTTRSGDSRPCTSAGAVGSASGGTQPAGAVAGAVAGGVGSATTGDAAAPSAAAATTARETSNPGESSRPVQADASLPPSPPAAAAAAAAATDSSGNQIGRDCNEGKRAREAQQQEEVEAGGTDAAGEGRSKRLKAADETVMSAPEGEAKAEDATMEEAAVKVEQQDGSQAKEPSLQCATACGDPAARASARSSSGGAGPVVERAGSMDGRDAATDIESATLGQLYSTIAQ